MDYEEISDVQRNLRMPSSGTYTDRNESKMHGYAAGTGTGGAGAGSLVVRDAGGLSPSATVHGVDPALYSKVIRRCTPTTRSLSNTAYALTSVCAASSFTSVSPSEKILESLNFACRCPRQLIN